MSHILIIEDEPDIAMGLEADLVRHGHQVAVARDGEAGLSRARHPQWDVILLDVMLPLRDGFDVCRELRRAHIRTPVIMLTAKSMEAEKILGLEVGADDYVTKPFSAAELRARIKALVRRTAGEDGLQGTYRFGDCDVDFDRGEVRRAGQSVAATSLEFRLLGCLVQRRGRVLSREQLIQHVWGDGVHIGDRVVDTHILNLRKKVEPRPESPKFIVSVRGLGYRFDG